MVGGTWSSSENTAFMFNLQVLFSVLKFSHEYTTSSISALNRQKNIVILLTRKKYNVFLSFVL